MNVQRLSWVGSQVGRPTQGRNAGMQPWSLQGRRSGFKPAPGSGRDGPALSRTARTWSPLGLLARGAFDVDLVRVAEI